MSILGSDTACPGAVGLFEFFQQVVGEAVGCSHALDAEQRVEYVHGILAFGASAVLGTSSIVTVAFTRFVRVAVLSAIASGHWLGLCQSSSQIGPFGAERRRRE